MERDSDDRAWMRGKTYSTLCFVYDAERYLRGHPGEAQRDRLEQFIARLRQGQHVLHEAMTVELFLQGLTHPQYLRALDAFPTLSLDDPNVPELRRRIRHYQAISRRYQVVCKTPCYVGQGLCFEYGDVLDTYYERSEAELKLQQVNADSWCLDCWELRELEPRCASHLWCDEAEGRR